MTDLDKLDALAAAATPTTEAGRWLLDHQGLVNIGKIDGSMRGDEIDLRAAIVTIETEARDKAARERDELRAAVADLLALPANYRSAVAIDGIEYDPKSGEGVIRRLRAALHSKDGAS